MQFHADDLDGATIYDPQGDKIGKVDDLYVDQETGQPEWLLISTGLFHGTDIVPTRGMSAVDDGFQVPFSKDVVRDAPDVSTEDDELSRADEQRLYDYYGLPYGTERSDSILPEGGVGGQATGRGDDAMTRSEEVLDVGKVRRPTERVRLKKRIVTENVQQTVPVQREELIVEREPITDENRDRALDGPELSENEYETTLSQEEVVTDKHVEPRERVRLDKDVQTEQQSVDEELRKEQIDIERERTDEERAA